MLCFGNTEIFCFNFFITSDNIHLEMKNHLKWNIPFSLLSEFFLTIFFPLRLNEPARYAQK